MFLAGISEFYLLAALAYATTLRAQPAYPAITAGYLAALTLTALAAISGAVRYLELGDVLFWHKELSFYSKHLAMPAFVILALWPNLPSSKTRLIAIGLLTMSLVSCLLNLNYSLGVLSDGIIVSAILLAAYTLRDNRQILSQIIVALALLLSTLLWSALITDSSLRIGVFHLCLGSVFVLLARSLNASANDHKVAASAF